MRGAGDVLGESQTGHMKLIGVDLYQHMLELALLSARGEATDDWQPDIRIGLQGQLPVDWLPDIDLRLQLYARLARVRSIDAAEALEDELVDRFGSLPPQVEDLLAATRLRVMARCLGLRRVDAGRAAIALTPGPAASMAGWSDQGLERSGARFLLKKDVGNVRERTQLLDQLLDVLLPD